MNTVSFAHFCSSHGRVDLVLKQLSTCLSVDCYISPLPIQLQTVSLMHSKIKIDRLPTNYQSFYHHHPNYKYNTQLSHSGDYFHVMVIIRANATRELSFAPLWRDFFLPSTGLNNTKQGHRSLWSTVALPTI